VELRKDELARDRGESHGRASSGGSTASRGMKGNRKEEMRELYPGNVSRNLASLRGTR
jgi:hypothetical protein